MSKFNINFFKGDYMLRENKILFNLYQMYKLFIFYPLLGVSTVTLGFISIFLALLAGQKIASIPGVIWARFNSFVTPMFVKVRGTENIDSTQSYVIVANHQSQYDIFAVYGWLPVDFKWVMKMELRGVPVLGYSCYRMGHVFIDRSNPEVAIRQIKDARNRIKGGTSIVFFPEGHRNSGDKLLPFKKGAFNFAIEAGFPILPVTIIGTGDVLPSNSTALFPGKAELVIHKPIPVDGYNRDNIQELMDESKRIIEEELDL